MIHPFSVRYSRGFALVGFAALGFLARGTARAAEPKNAEEAFAELAKVIKPVTTWSADADIDMPGMSVNQKGSIAAKGDLFRAEFSMKAMGEDLKMQMVNDATDTMYVNVIQRGPSLVLKMDTKAVKAVAGDKMGKMGGGFGGFGGGTMMQNPAEIFQSMHKTADLAFKGVEQRDGIEVMLFEGPLKDDAGEALGSLGLPTAAISMKNIRAAVGRADGFPRELTYLSADGKPTLSLKYTNVKLNPPLEAADFVFKMPEGTVATDVTEMVKTQFTAVPGAAADPAAAQAGEKKVEFNSGLKAGAMLKPFEAKTLDGGTFKLSAVKGNPLLIHFWASWRKAAAAQVDTIAALYEAHREHGFEVLGVSLDRSEAEIKGFLEAHPKAVWPQIYDGKGWKNGVAQLFGVDQIPFNVLVDPAGKINYVGSDQTELEKAVDALLKASTK